MEGAAVNWWLGKLVHTVLRLTEGAANPSRPPVHLEVGNAAGSGLRLNAIEDGILRNTT